MSLTTTIPTLTVNTDAATVDFDFSFKMWAATVASELVVTLDKGETTEEVLAHGTDYTLSAANNDYSSGGTVTTITTYAAGRTITIKSKLTRSQTYDLIHGDELNTDNLEDALDRMVRIVQELELTGGIEQFAVNLDPDDILCYEGEVLTYEGNVLI